MTQIRHCVIDYCLEGKLRRQTVSVCESGEGLALFRADPVMGSFGTGRLWKSIGMRPFASHRGPNVTAL